MPLEVKDTTAGGSLAGPEATVTIPLAGGGDVLEAVYLARPNRFLIEARLADGAVVQAHCADRGRLLWLQEGMPLLVCVRSGERRKTGYQAAAAWHENGWSSIDTCLPNRLVEAALRARRLPPFADATGIRREVRVGGSRFDFAVESGGRRCLLEVKSVGAVKDGIALFPDAPTSRGQRHLRELTDLAKSGGRAAVLFVAQHGAAQAVMPHETIDPGFTDALRAAADAGVELYAYRCPLTPGGITLGAEIPLNIPPACPPHG